MEVAVWGKERFRARYMYIRSEHVLQFEHVIYRPSEGQCTLHSMNVKVTG